MQESSVFQTYFQTYTEQISQLVQQYPILQRAVDFIAIVVPLSFLLALSGICVMSLIGQTLAVKRERSAYDKAGRQLSKLASWISWPLAAGGATALALKNAFVWQPEAILDSAPLWAWCAITVAAIFISLHCALWRKMKTSPILHRILALIATASAMCGGYLLLAFVVAQGQVDSGMGAPQSMSELLVPNDDSLLWNVIYYMPVLTFSMAAGWASLWLMVRRNRDPFGRDYYNLILPWVVSWARNAWLCLWFILMAFTCISLVSEANEVVSLPMQDILNHLVRLVLWLIPLMLWFIVARSQTPMRHKFTLLLAQLLAMGFLVPFYWGLTWGV